MSLVEQTRAELDRKARSGKLATPSRKTLHSLADQFEARARIILD